jgi:hypothetical protein
VTLGSDTGPCEIIGMPLFWQQSLENQQMLPKQNITTAVVNATGIVEFWQKVFARGDDD